MKRFIHHQIVWRITRLPFVERQLRRFTTGKEYGSLLTKLASSPYHYPKGSYRQGSRRGANYRLDLSQLGDWWVYFGFHNNEWPWFERALPKGGVACDVGANMGIYALALAARVGRQGKVVGFEPGKANMERLQANIALNDFPQLTVERYGLGESPSKVTLDVVPDDLGKCRISGANPSLDNSVAEEIELLTLDEYFEERPIERLDLMKVDVEGYELNVLRGGRKTLERFRPCLFLEIDDNYLKSNGHSASQALAWVEALGYQIYSGDSKKKKRISSQDPLEGVHMDVFCFPDEKGGLFADVLS